MKYLIATFILLIFVSVGVEAKTTSKTKRPLVITTDTIEFTVSSSNGFDLSLVDFSKIEFSVFKYKLTKRKFDLKKTMHVTATKIIEKGNTRIVKLAIKTLAMKRRPYKNYLLCVSYDHSIAVFECLNGFEQTDLNVLYHIPDIQKIYPIRFPVNNPINKFELIIQGKNSADNQLLTTH